MQPGERAEFLFVADNPGLAVSLPYGLMRPAWVVLFQSAKGIKSDIHFPLMVPLPENGDLLIHNQ